jgi:hypothetical protein
MDALRHPLRRVVPQRLSVTPSQWLEGRRFVFVFAGFGWFELGRGLIDGVGLGRFVVDAAGGGGPAEGAVG